MMSGLLAEEKVVKETNLIIETEFAPWIGPNNLAHL